MRIVLVLILAFAAGSSAVASEYGNVQGTVTVLGTNRILRGAKVHINSANYRGTATTDANGRFSFLAVPPDAYNISVSINGFNEFDPGRICVHSGDNQRISLHVTRMDILWSPQAIQSRSDAFARRAWLSRTADEYTVGQC
jgi:Carboxypeptidase regulatory-like domain